VINIDEIVSEAIAENLNFYITKREISLKEVFKIRKSGNYIEISDEFFDSLESFAIGYALICGMIKDEKVKICSKCFRNFMLNKAEEKDLPNFYIKLFSLMIKNTRHSEFCPARKLV